RLTFMNGLITRMETTDTAETDGGNDIIDGDDVADTVLGGVGADVLRGEASAPSLIGTAGPDIVVGDEGRLRWDVTVAEGGDSNPNTLDLIETLPFAPASTTVLGVADQLFGDADSDILLGGTGGDNIYGDDATGSAASADLMD